MAAKKEDAEREERITMEIVVDAYGPEERAMGWHAYLEMTLQFPFKAKVINRRSTSPLRVGRPVTVTAMADSDECLHDMFVTVEWEDEDGDDDELDVPLSQLRPVRAGAETSQAVADWHYWTEMGYQF